MIVEALLDQTEDLRFRGDLPALQTLEAKQRDGGNREHLDTDMITEAQRKNERKEYREFSILGGFLTVGTTLTERMGQLGGQPMLVKLG